MRRALRPRFLPVSRKTLHSKGGKHICVFRSSSPHSEQGQPARSGSVSTRRNRPLARAVSRFCLLHTTTLPLPARHGTVRSGQVGNGLNAPPAPSSLTTVGLFNLVCSVILLKCESQDVTLPLKSPLSPSGLKGQI